MDYMLRCMVKLMKTSPPNGSWSNITTNEVIVGFVGYGILFGIVFLAIWICGKYFKK